MQKIDCPYCSLALKKGELYCSRHNMDMASLKSGVFFIDTDRFDECDWHVTRLSMNFNFDDKQTYRSGQREFAVTPERFLLLNEGQSFKTFANGSKRSRMITIAFQVGLAEQLTNELSSSEQNLLDNPFKEIDDKVCFFEQTYPVVPGLASKVLRLTALNDETELDQALEDLLVEMIVDQLAIRRGILSINKSKPSTRLEIYKRLHWSLDFLHANFNTELTVEQLAQVSCLSVFHYKRLFSDLFGVSPYQYLISLRLKQACALLKDGLPVNDVCRHVGWKDPSSFSRLFKREFSVTPEKFKKRIR